MVYNHHKKTLTYHNESKIFEEWILDMKKQYPDVTKYICSFNDIPELRIIDATFFKVFYL